MNLTASTYSSARSSARRRLRGHQITLAAGIALAATAAIGFAYQGAFSDGDASRGLEWQPAAPGANLAPRQVFYIVDSESRRQEISMAVGELAHAYVGGLPPVLVTAVVAEPGDLQANLLLATMAGELMHYAPDAQIVDLR